MVAGQEPPRHLHRLAHGGERLPQHAGRGRRGVECIARQEHMRRPVFPRGLSQFGNGAMPRFHQTPPDIAVRRLRNIREFAPDMQVGRVDEAECHAGVLNGFGKGRGFNRQRAMVDRLRGQPGRPIAATPFIANSARSARPCKICANFWHSADCALTMPETRSKRSGAIAQTRQFRDRIPCRPAFEIRPRVAGTACQLRASSRPSACRSALSIG